MGDDSRITSRPQAQMVQGISANEVLKDSKGNIRVEVGKTLPNKTSSEQTSGAGQDLEWTNLDEIVAKANEYATSMSRDIRFSKGEKTGKTIITVIDSQTEEIIRQIPPEEVLSLAKFLQDEGHLYKTKI